MCASQLLLLQIKFCIYVQTTPLFFGVQQIDVGIENKIEKH
jgi:hypothetical protein